MESNFGFLKPQEQISQKDGEKTMKAEMKNKLESCFSRESSQEDCQGAILYIKQNLDQIDFEDDSDMRDMTDIILRILESSRCSSSGDTSKKRSVCEQFAQSKLEFIKFLILNGFDINYKLAGNDCLLLKYIDHASENGSLELEVIKKLVELGADVCSETLDGDNVLSVLAGRDEAAAVSMAECYDLTEFDKTDKYGATPLMYAAMRGYNRLARVLIDQGFDVNETGRAPVSDKEPEIEMDGVSPLALAIRFGNVEIVRMLLEAGADETSCDAEGNPPIFSLVRYPDDFFREYYGHFIKEDHPLFENKRKIVSLLEQLDLTNAEGYTVLMKSLFPMKFWYTGHREGISPQKNLVIALELIEKGADVNAIGNDGKSPLHQAAAAVEEAARALVKAGADINAQDNEGNTPLIYACMKAKEETVLWLLKAGADYRIQNNEGMTAEDIAAKKGYSRALELMKPDDTLLQACRNNQKRAVQVILKRGGAEINERDEECGTPLLYACRNNAPDIVKLLLDHGADPNLGDQKGYMPLHFAAAMGSLPIINLLVNAGADVNCTDNNGDTPLMFMAKNNRTAAALHFIKNPLVDVSIRDNAGRTAVTYAIAAGGQQLVKTLLPLPGTNAEDTDMNGFTMLHYACQFGQLEIVRYLLERNQDSINKAGNNGETPLTMAARNSNLVIVKLLLEAGAAADCSNGEGVTALHLGAAKGNAFLGKTLLDYGADINAKTGEGHTPLMYAIAEGKSEFAEMLIREGADVNVVDNEQCDALSYAVDAEMPQIVELLLAAGSEK